MQDNELRAGLRSFEEREGISLREHSRRLGVAPITLSEFLRGHTNLGGKMLSAIWALHPELNRALMRYLDEHGSQRVGSIPRPEREPAATGPPPTPRS